MTRSYEKINYSIRPAKCIERKMLSEAFRRLSIFGKIESYNYVGFGSAYFSDFNLFHRSLNLNNMISIEKDEFNKERFESNRPFKCIEMRYGKSNDILLQLNLTIKTILWLDYDSRLDNNVLQDVQHFCSESSSGNLIIISINVEPGEDIDRRKENLSQEVGSSKIPMEVKEKDFIGWGTGKICRKIIFNEIMQTLNDRNGVLPHGNRICYKQLFNFHYSDGAKMLTTGGILYEEGQSNNLNQCGFDDLSFVREADEPYLIEVPNLTFKEIRYIDEQLPRQDGVGVSSPAVKEKEIKKYEKIYRYFPAFTEINIA
jgi:hypothetical protein